MAQQRNQLDSLGISCSLCLELLRDPVTIPCGHSYCMSCIQRHWEDEDSKGIHSCPLCRKTFIPKPVLVKSVMLAELVEELKKSGLGAPPADLCYAGAEDVACDVCTDRKLKAVKSCLVCVASYCQQHLQPHYHAAPLQKHQLVEPSHKLQENVCSRHHEPRKVFCRTDQQCICYLCTMEEHRGHDTVPAAAERRQKQEKLALSRQQVQQRIQEGEEKLKVLQQQAEAVNVSTDGAMKECERICTQLIRLIQERRREVEQQLRGQQQVQLSGIGDLQEKLLQEIAELKMKDGQMEQLTHTRDDRQFLHNYPSVCALSQPTCFPSIPTAPGSIFEDVLAALSQSSQKIQRVLRGEETSIPQAAPQVALSPQAAGLLSYSCDLTLDPHTAHKRLVLSEDNRKVTLSRQGQPYSSHQSRFTYYWQVLSRESLTGRCYWEVEWKGRGVDVAVTYQDISRTGGKESLFGWNNKSWALLCNTAGYTFYNNSQSTKLSAPPCNRVGVFLDHRAGILSFYSVSESRTLLHQIHTTFTQPLYAGFRLCWTDGDTAKFCRLNQTKKGLCKVVAPKKKPSSFL